MSLCECGCGQEAKPGMRYIYTHHRRGKTHSEETKKKMSETTKNSDAHKAASEAMVGVPRLPEICAAISESKIGIPHTSPAQIAADKAKRGGNDICDHHYIYDHSDLSKYTMKMTRSRHQRLHRLMQISGIKVPHINMVKE